MPTEGRSLGSIYFNIFTSDFHNTTLGTQTLFNIVGTLLSAILKSKTCQQRRHECCVQTALRCVGNIIFHSKHFVTRKECTQLNETKAPVTVEYMPIIASFPGTTMTLIGQWCCHRLTTAAWCLCDFCRPTWCQIKQVEIWKARW